MRRALETCRHTISARTGLSGNAGLPRQALLFLFLLSFCIPLASDPAEEQALRVGIFLEREISSSPDDTRQFSLDVLGVLESAGTQFRPSLVTPAQIAAGTLDALDVVVFPGGIASSQMTSLGPDGAERVREFVSAGGGYVGICAGAYLARCRPGASAHRVLNLVSAVLVDGGDTWQRGAGTVRVTMTEGGKRLFPELAGERRLSFRYINGPVMQRHAAEGLRPFETLMTFDTEIGGGETSGEVPLPGGARAVTAMKGTPFMMSSRYGRGRVLIVSGHPEISPGLQWVVHRMVALAAGREAVPQEAQAVERTGDEGS